MSVVGVYVSPQGAVIAGDTKLSGNPNQTTIQKVFRKENILLGWTGSLPDAVRYLNPLFNAKMQINEEYAWGDSVDFIQFLDRKFYETIRLGRKYETTFVVVTRIGDKYYAKSYQASCDDNIYQSPFEVISYEYGPQCFILGKQIHKEFLEKCAISTKEDFLNAFQLMLNEGIKYDSSINSSMEYVCM